MKNLRIIFIFVLIVIVTCCGRRDFQPATHIDKNKIETELVSRLNELYGTYKIHGDFLLGIVNSEGLQYFVSKKGDSPESQARILSEETPIYIASHTKAFTGTLMKMLETQKLIGLNNPVSKYMPEITFGGRANPDSITIKQLLSHTSGIHSTPLVWCTAFLGYSGGNEKLTQLLNQHGQFLPAGEFRYSNVGPIIAAMIADKVTGVSWKNQFQSKIFQPLGMRNTSAYISKINQNALLPSISTSGGEYYESSFQKTDLTMHAAGGAVSTIADLAKWLQFNINRGLSPNGTEVLKSVAFDELHGLVAKQDRKFFTYKRFGYSLGWDLAEYQGDTILTRFGGYGGISFHASFFPSRNVGIVAFSNDDRAVYLPHLFANLAYNLINSNADWAKIYSEENLISGKRFEQAKKHILPKKSSFVKNTPRYAGLLGKYQSNSVWPDIAIEDNGEYLQFRWGELSGNFTRREKFKENTFSFTANLGVLRRDFAVHVKSGTADSLFTGSLIYLKTD